MVASAQVSRLCDVLNSLSRKRGKAGKASTNLLRSEIIADGILKAFANSLLGDRIQVAFTQNGVNDPRILVAQLGRNYCARSERNEYIVGDRSLKPEAGRGNIRDILPVDQPRR